MKTHFNRKVYVNCTLSFMVASGRVEHISEVMTNCSFGKGKENRK